MDNTKTYRADAGVETPEIDPSTEILSDIQEGQFGPSWLFQTEDDDSSIPVVIDFPVIQDPPEDSLEDCE